MDAREGGGGLVVISGPSGAGKTTIARAVSERVPGAVLSVSATTRTKTDRDVEGRDYFFLDDAEFQRRVDEGAFLEHAQYAGRRYGTLRAPVEERLREGRIVVLEIDVQGGEQIHRLMPEMLGIFVLPPSEAVLLGRLRARKREPEEAIQRRFAIAREEIARAQASDVYDRYVVNDDLERAIGEVVRVVSREAGAQPR